MKCKLGILALVSGFAFTPVAQVSAAGASPMLVSSRHSIPVTGQDSTIASDTSAVTPIDPAQTRVVEQWIASNAIPLKSVQAGAGFADLAPLETVLRNVRVVGVGEATHGSREFFQFKHRMLEFLVTRMGFRTFAIEASEVACHNINDYVLYGKGDRAKALASQGFWTWDTNEVSDMIDWMREYNSKVAESERVRFVGYDIQVYDEAFPIITHYLQRVAPSYVPAAELAFEPLKLKPDAFMGRSADQKAQDMARLWELFDFLDSHHDDFVRQTSDTAFAKVLQFARILLQYDDAYSSGFNNPEHPEEGAGAKRDRYMAENIMRILNAAGPNARMMVWAHNGHISTSDRNMGAHLRHELGERYYALGQAFDHGSFQSREIGAKSVGGLREFTLSPAQSGSVEWYLEGAREGKPFTNYIINLRAAPTTGPMAQWLSSPHPMVSIGSGFSTSWTPDKYTEPTTLHDAFDGLVFIETTTRARPNPTGMRPQPAKQ